MFGMRSRRDAPAGRPKGSVHRRRARLWNFVLQHRAAEKTRQLSDDNSWSVAGATPPMSGR